MINRKWLCFCALAAAQIMSGCDNKAVHEIDSRCAGIDCGGHGMCIENTDGTILCQCEEGYQVLPESPLSCVEFDPCDGIDCGGHGKCKITNDNSVVCMCDVGYENTADAPLICTIPEQCVGVDCGEHGICYVEHDIYGEFGDYRGCGCDDGYYRDYYNSSVCTSNEFGPCANIDCGGHGRCIVAEHFFPMCVCDEGYINSPDDLNVCVEPDPCEDIDCDGHGQCMVTADKQPFCKCDDGYTPTNEDPLICIIDLPITECDDPKDENHNYMRDCAETASDQGKDCSATHSGCTQFCDSFLYSKCSTLCRTDSQCISDEYFCRSDGRCAPKVFETIWQVDEDNTKLYFPGGVGKCNYTIDWGDGKTEHYTKCKSVREHTYAKAGIYSIKVTGKIEGWTCFAEYTLSLEYCKAYCQTNAPDDNECVKHCHNPGYEWHRACERIYRDSYEHVYHYPKGYLIEVKSFGPMHPGKSTLTLVVIIRPNGEPYSYYESRDTGVFAYADKLTKVSDIDIPNFKGIHRIEIMFLFAPIFNSDINRWDTSSIHSMNGLFEFAESFNSPLNNWDTSRVTDMTALFRGTIFNQPIGNWNTSKVTKMNYMFELATEFNQPIGDWDTSNVTQMKDMFCDAHQFNQPIGTWNVSKLKDVDNMFVRAYRFNQPLEDWNISSLTSLWDMFGDAISFNQPLNKWDTSRIESMAFAFTGASSFNQPLDNWNTTNVAEFYGMFEDAISFNQSLAKWDVSTKAGLFGFRYDNMLRNCGISKENWEDMVNNNDGWAQMNKFLLGILY